jgi:hypothetical protein
MKNYLVLSGVISLMLAGAHLWWGLTYTLPELAPLSEMARASVEIAWYQAGATLLVGGMALIVHGFSRSAVRAVPALVLAIYGANFGLGVALVLFDYRALIPQIVPQLVFFTLMLAFLALALFARGPPPATVRRDPQLH